MEKDLSDLVKIWPRYVWLSVLECLKIADRKQGFSLAEKCIPGTKSDVTAREWMLDTCDICCGVCTIFICAQMYLRVASL
jgi:hypothetical protein